MAKTIFTTEELVNDASGFDTAFNRTLGFEGGYTVDHAGPTNLGITQTTYDNWRKKQGLPTKPVKLADVNEAKKLYKDEYFDKPGFSKLPENVAGVLFDYGVNAGTPRAAMALQKAVGASPDGVIGPKTLNTVNSFVAKNGEKALLQRIVDDRSQHNNKLITKNPSKFKKFANGWNNRINAIKSEFNLSSLNPLSSTEAEASDQTPDNTFTTEQLFGSEIPKAATPSAQDTFTTEELFNMPDEHYKNMMQTPDTLRQGTPNNDPATTYRPGVVPEGTERLSAFLNNLVKESPVGIAKRISTGKPFLTPVEQAISEKYKGASMAGGILGGLESLIPLTVMPQVGLPVAFGASSVLSKTAEQADRSQNPKYQFTIPGIVAEDAISAAGGALTGKVFATAQAGKTIASRLFARAGSAGAITTGQSLLEQKARGDEQNVPQALFEGGVQAITVGLLGAMVEVPQLRGAIMKEAQSISRKPIQSLDEAKAILVQAGIKPETLSPEFQRSLSNTLRTLAKEVVTKRADELGVPAKVMADVLNAQNIAQRDAVLAKYITGIKNIEPKKAELLAGFYNEIKNGADPTRILLSYDIYKNLKPSASITEFVGELTGKKPTAINTQDKVSSNIVNLGKFVIDRRNSDMIPQPKSPKNRLSDWTSILDAYDDAGKKYQISKLNVDDAVKGRLLDHYGLLFDKPTTPVERAAQHGEVVGIDAKSGLPVIDTSVKPTEIKPVEAAQTTTPNLTPKQTVALAPSTDTFTGGPEGKLIDLPRDAEVLKDKLFYDVRKNTSDEIDRVISNLSGDKPIIVYRATDKKTIEGGRRVTPFRNIAEEYSFKGDVKSLKVSPKDLKIEEDSGHLIYLPKGGDSNGKSQETSKENNEEEVLTPQGLEAITQKAPATDLHAEALKYKTAEEFVKENETPKTVRVWNKSKFSDSGAYADIPVIRKVDNITLYQGGSSEGRQFWTPDEKYASQFGKVTKKTGTFYKVDNGNRVADVYVEGKTKSQLTAIWNEAHKADTAKAGKPAANIRFNRSGDAVGQEYHETIQAIDENSGKVLGYVDYVYYKGKSSIKMIEVKPEERRKGVATALLNEIKGKSAKDNVDILGDVITPEGKSLFSKWKESPDVPTKGAAADTAKAGKPAAGIENLDTIKILSFFKGGNNIIVEPKDFEEYSLNQLGIKSSVKEIPQGTVIEVETPQSAETIRRLFSQHDILSSKAGDTISQQILIGPRKKDFFGGKYVPNVKYISGKGLVDIGKLTKEDTSIHNKAYGITGKGKPTSKPSTKKSENTYTDEDKKDIATLTDIEINMPNGEKWTYNIADSSETQFSGNPSGHSETMQSIGIKESFKILAMAQEGKPLTALQKKRVDELLADFRANIKPSLERLDDEATKIVGDITEPETTKVISHFEDEEGTSPKSSEETPESNITPSGQIRLELLQPERKELFQEEGELFKGNKGIDASTGGKSIDSFEDQTKPTGTPEEFKLFEEVQALAKKWIKSPIGEKYHPKGTAGARFRDNGTILINSMNNLSTMIHEVAHDLSSKNTFIKDVMKVKGYAKNGNPIYDTATRQARRELTDIYVKYYSGGKSDHALEKRVNEGYSMFAQRMVEAPELTRKEFPYLYAQVYSTGGKYNDPKFAELVSDGQRIVKKYQALSPLQKMGARVLNTGRDIDKKSFLSPEERIIEEGADRIYPIEKMAKEAGIAGTVDDPSLWARAYNVIRYIALENINTHNGYVTIRNGEFKKIYDFNWKTLLENLHKEGGDKNLEDFSYWLVARRVHYAYERLEKMKKELVELSDAMKDIPKEEVSKEDVKNLQDKIKEYKELESVLKSDNINSKLATESFNSESKRFEKHAEMFDKLVRADLDLLHSKEVQLVNDKRYEKLTEEKGYAPFQRDIFNEIIGTPSDDRPVARSLTGKNKISSMLGRTGSELPIVSPVYGAMMNHLEILKKANRQIIYNIIGEKVASHYPELFRSVPVTKAVSEDGRISYPQEKDRNIMMTYSGQKRQAFVVDEEVKALIDELFTFEDRHLLEKALVKASSLFTKGTTGLYPPFAIANFVVDQFTAVAQTKNNLIPLISQVKLLYKMLSKMSGKEAQYFKEYLMLGGERQTFVEISELSPEESYRELLKERDLLHKAMALINDGVNILSLPAKYSEIITRGTEYVLARMKGKPQLAALEEAGRVTAPFHHEGRAGGHVGRSYVKSMPYFKARLQVIAQMGRSLLSDKKSRNRALFVIAAITAANVAAFMYLLENATDEQKENYNGLSPRELSGYIFLPNPNGHDLTRIRVPEQMNFIATLSNMIIADKFNNAKYKPYDYVNAGTAWLPDQLNVTDPQRQFLSMWPQLMVPAAGLVLNKRTYPEVRDLESRSMQARPPKYRYYENTSKAALAIGQQLDISPIKVDFLIEGYLGRSTRFATGKEVSNPLVRKVYLESMRQVENFYDLKQKVDQDRKALRDELRKERYKGEEEDLDILNEDIKDIDRNLKEYREIKKLDRNNPELKKVRRDILKGINELPRKLK